MANLYSILDSLEKEFVQRGGGNAPVAIDKRTDAEDFNAELRNVWNSVPEYNLRTGERTPNTDMQKAINEYLRDEVRTITSPRDMGVIDNAIREFNLQALAKGLNYKGLDIDRREVNTMKDILTDQNMIDIGKLSGVSQVKNLQEYYDREGKLPSFLSLARNQFTPSGLESLLDRELDAIDNPNLSTGTRISTYDPITPENQDKTFSNREITALGAMLAARDKDKDNKMAVGEIDTAIYATPANKADELNIELDNIDNPNLGNIDYLRGKTISDALHDSFGLGKYGHYDRMSGEWQAGIPDEEGNYTFKDDYNWNKSRQSGIRSMIDLALAPSKRNDQQKVEGIFQTLGPDSRKNEGQKIEINVPTYANDPMQQMNLLSSKLGPYDKVTREGIGRYVVDRMTPLGQGDLPGIYWQPKAFTSSEGNEVDDSDANYGGFGDFGDDFGGYGMKGGGYIFREVNKLKMNDRNAKNNLYEMIGIKPVVAKQYGGGLSDAYSTLADRRQNMYGMGQTPSQMSSVFQDPMEASAFSPVNMEQGGDIVVPTIYRQEGGGMDDDYSESDLADAGFDEGDFSYGDDGSSMFDNVESYMGTQTSEEQAAAQQAAQDINDELADIRSDQQMNYEQYYGRSGDGRPSFTESGEFIYGRPGGPEGSSQQDYINRLNKEGLPSWTYPYYNSLKDRGMTNDEATAALAAAMATPGGLSGMQSGNYSYGGPMGTMEDLLEKGMASRVNINNLIEEDKDIKAYNKDDDEEFLSEGELSVSGLKGIYDTISNALSLKGNLTPTTMELIDSKFTEEGLNFTPASGAMGTLMNFLVPSVAKGLSNLTDAGRTIGTVTDPKTGQSFNVSDTGKFSLNLDPAEVDSGNDQPERKRIVKPDIPKEVTEVVEEKEEVTTDGKLSNRAKASAESIKSLIKLRNASSDAQIDAIISDLGIDKAGLTVSEFLKELGIER